MKALGGEVMLIAGAEDAASCAPLLAAAPDRVAAFHAELLLTGLLHQQLDRTHHRITFAATTPASSRRGK